MRLHVTYQGGDRDGKSELRELSEFPIELAEGRYELTFRHASQEPDPTEAAAKWVSQERPQSIEQPAGKPSIGEPSK
jgi:hypothetical protein